MLRMHQVTFAYAGGPTVLEGFSWEVAAGEVWAVLGPSGCGKSTLLQLAAGLLFPQRGEVWVGGESLMRPRPRTGFILQEYGLLPWATVWENVALGLRIWRLYGPDGRHGPRDVRITRREIEARVARWLQRLGIAAVADKYPSQVSGGQRQRAAIARTLVLDPDLLLMDEPFSALDAPTREALQVLTLQLCAEARRTVVLVTHSIEEAAFVGQRVLVLPPPPIRRAQVVENPHASQADYRHSPAYQAICSRLRRLLGREAGDR